VRAAGVAGVRDVVPTFRSVAVFFDRCAPTWTPLRALLQRSPRTTRSARGGATVEIPVEYGGESGPDLDAVAAAMRLAPDDVVARHSAREYRVFMVGFLPGFGVPRRGDPAIAAAAARLAAPARPARVGGYRRTADRRVSADVAGRLAACRRTTTKPFDAARAPASLLAPGDRVRFVPVPAGLARFFRCRVGGAAGTGRRGLHAPSSSHPPGRG
jgi:allophanate hydrolase subunit 1